MLRSFFILVGCVSVSTAVAYWQTGLEREGRRNATAPLGDVNRYRPVKVLREPIRAIVDPKLVTASESTLSPNELVIGVERDGHARAYSINQLTGPQREIINDVLGGTAIAATW